VYRLEAEEQLPCILPVIGYFPLTPSDLDNTPSLTPQEPFGLLSIGQPLQVVSIPTWQVVLQAKNPVVIFCQTPDLPKETGGKPEEVLIVVDMDAKQWSVNNYFLVNESGEIKLMWLPEDSKIEILGKLLVVLKQKKILDEGNLTEPWQMDD